MRVARSVVEACRSHTLVVVAARVHSARAERDAPDFERMLVESGITLVKLWLDISKKEQAEPASYGE